MEISFGDRDSRNKRDNRYMTNRTKFYISKWLEENAV